MTEFWLFQFTLITLGFLLPIFASIKACKLYDGVELPLWLILIWIVPFAGPILCFSITPTSTEVSKEKKLWQRFYEEAPHRKHLNRSEKFEAFKKWADENHLDG